MAFRYTTVKHYRRGATWPDGKPRYCTRCGIEGRRRRRATTTAILRNGPGSNKVPVAYCTEHTPEEIRP